MEPCASIRKFVAVTFFVLEAALMRSSPVMMETSVAVTLPIVMSPAALRRAAEFVAVMSAEPCIVKAPVSASTEMVPVEAV